MPKHDCLPPHQTGREDFPHLAFTQTLAAQQYTGTGRPSSAAQLRSNMRTVPPLCTNEFELFTDYGIRIQARSKALQTFVIQLVGSCLLPPDRQRLHPCPLIVEPELGGTALEFPFGFFPPAELFVPVLGAGYKLDEVLAPAVVALLQRGTAPVARADGRLLVPKAQCRSVAFPPVIGDIAEMTVAHIASLLADTLSGGIRQGEAF